MRRRNPVLLTTLTLLVAGGLPGCDDNSGRRSDSADKQPAAAAGRHDAPAEHHHTHAAPHGGTIVVLEDEVANLELLLDPQTGVLTAWVFDGCLDRALRVKQAQLEIVVMRPAADGSGESVFAVNLKACASVLTGETVGDTSQFSGAHDMLKGAHQFGGIVRQLGVRSAEYSEVKFEYVATPEANRK